MNIFIIFAALSPWILVVLMTAWLLFYAEINARTFFLIVIAPSFILVFAGWIMLLSQSGWWCRRFHGAYYRARGKYENYMVCSRCYPEATNDGRILDEDTKKWL